ncbi:Two-component response regulator [Quillaja saponaria]|uniref:Two-component response regulator n=1 Tax=Quillaja saponaria TaxID=32244 RepID=A0AAD7Q0J9_QUISA|nr:Two-component response regulator [Quillaja saponaria]
MSVDGCNKEFLKLTHHTQDGGKTCKDGAFVERQGVHVEDGMRSNEITKKGKDGQGGTVGGSVVLQIPQQQPHGAIVCWERFLHVRTLKVLLVENDDSTRHVVTALLRNCSYEVIEAANGLQAWKILVDLTNHVDLVLTEVAMPCFSGIGLLCKIMSHKTRKNIPVIMMSCHDSMGIVFKCLSKGAVDFLVKPIRKNELKNLWQHVWRRCHSSSGSGSESGTQTQKSVKSKRLEKSENNTGSSDEDDTGSIGVNVGVGSDNGSGTQSSWTKRAGEFDSPRPMSLWNQIPECPDSICAQVVHSNTEISENKMVPECQDQKEQLGLNKCNKHIIRGQLDLNCESPTSKLSCEGAAPRGAITSSSDPHMHNEEFEAPNRRPTMSDIGNIATNITEVLPSLELSLKRLRRIKDTGNTTQDDRNVLRRSDLSAFSRYNASSSTKKSPMWYVGSSSPYNNSLEATKKDSSHDMQSHLSGNPPNHNSNGASNNIDMGSTNNNAFTKSAVMSEPAVVSTVKCLYSSSAFLEHTAQQVLLHGTDDMTAKTLLAPSGGIQSDPQIQHLYHHIDNKMLRQLTRDHDDVSLKKMAAAVPHCGSSTVLDVLVEGNVGNCSINGSVSGSNNGSNGQNGNSTAVNTGGTNMESCNRTSGNSGNGGTSGSGSASIVDQNKTSQREAALTKFRQKRKERCFQKKVRYQSRKKLAEQRPRFRGQFVRYSGNE